MGIPHRKQLCCRSHSVPRRCVSPHHRDLAGFTLSLLEQQVTRPFTRPASWREARSFYVQVEFRRPGTVARLLAGVGGSHVANAAFVTTKAGNNVTAGGGEPFNSCVFSSRLEIPATSSGWHFCSNVRSEERSCGSAQR